jgi:NFU1 iron-sulfur cluster scaffold homolog, mitochondrial
VAGSVPAMGITSLVNRWNFPEHPRSIYQLQFARSIFIQTETTPNPETLKFLPGREVLGATFGTGVFFQKGDKREWQRSPLASRLFALEGVRNVFLGSDFVTVGKDPQEAWVGLKPQVFALLMDAFAEKDFQVIFDGDSEVSVSDTTILDDDSEIVAMIKELLETRIRPAVQEVS